MHSVEFLNLSFNHTSFNITYARSYNTTNLRGYLHVCVQLYMCLHSHIQFVLGCTKIHTGDMHVTPELYVVTAGVAIFFFPLGTNFSCFYWNTFAVWKRRASWPQGFFSWKSSPVFYIKIYVACLGLVLGFSSIDFCWYLFIQLTNDSQE